MNPIVAIIRDLQSRSHPDNQGREFELPKTRISLPTGRRGRKGALVSPDEERALADVLLAATRGMGYPARITFEDPDAILLVETIGGRAGMAIRTRDDYARHPLLAAR
jgi:hypothetical protein